MSAAQTQKLSLQDRCFLNLSIRVQSHCDIKHQVYAILSATKNAIQLGQVSVWPNHHFANQLLSQAPVPLNNRNTTVLVLTAQANGPA